MDDKEHREREHFFGAAKTVAGLTLLSRVLGMVRMMTIIWLGATWKNDAFQFAFALPNLFRRLFGEGALSAAFVPVFTETTDAGGIEKARRFLANSLGLLAVFLTGLTVLLQVGLLAFVLLSPPDRLDRQFLALLSSIMLPFMIMVCLLALASAALNCRGHFAFPAFAPIILNVCMIAADLVANHYWPGDVRNQFISISVSVTAAGVIQLIGAAWVLKAGGLSIRPRLRPVEPGVGKMLKLMGPALLGMGFLQISSLFDYFAALFLSTNEHTSATISVFGWQIARPLNEGALTCLNAAQMLYQFPMGVFAISLGVAVFPLLSRYASRNDMPNLRDSLNRAMRLAIMEGLATGTGLFILAGPIVQLIYRHYGFNAASADNAAFILRMYVIGMWAYCLYQILTRTFYAMKDTKTPLKIACTMAAVYIIVVSCLIWIRPLGAGAFGLTMTFTFTLNVIVMAVILRRRIGRIGGRKLAASAARSLAASGAMAGAIGILWWALGRSVAWAQGLSAPIESGLPSAAERLCVHSLQWLLGRGFNLTVVLSCVIVGAAVFVATCRLLRAPELGELRGSLKKNQTPGAA